VSRLIIGAFLVLSALLSVSSTPDVPTQFQSCPVTKPNWNIAPGQKPGTMTGEWYGNGDMWTVLWYDGTIVFQPGHIGSEEKDGSMGIKWPLVDGAKGSGSLEHYRTQARRASATLACLDSRRIWPTTSSYRFDFSNGRMLGGYREGWESQPHVCDSCDF
jgi:hypothetical protein